MIINNKEIKNLYLSGMSVKQISDFLDISSSKIRHSLDMQFVPRRNHIDASRMLYITKFGKKQFSLKGNLLPKEENLRIAGIMLYWGEGTKSGNSVVFTNSDPDMVILFLRFLRVICGIDEGRLRLLLHLYSDQNEEDMKLFWSKATNIPLDQFSKTYIHEKKKGVYKKISKYGTISLRYSDKELLKTINNWLKEYKMPM